MNNGLHVISGLPRSGSTLLAAILRQNPRVHAGMSSPVISLIQVLQRQMSQENEGAPFISDGQREAVLRGVVTGFYAAEHPDKTVIDTNRGWCAKLPLLARLFPRARVIACVRDVGWIMDSIERLIRANPLEPSRMFNFEPGGTVFSRVGGLASSDGMVGFALDALREAYFSPEAHRMMLITYETLTTSPSKTIDAVYRFLDLPPFAHDFDDVRYDADEFDRRLGLPGLHKVRPRVEAVARDTVLPPGLFARFGDDNFWRAGPNPRGVTVV